MKEEGYFDKVRDIRVFYLSDKDPDSKDDGARKTYLTEKLPITQKGKYYFQNKPNVGRVKKTLVLFRNKECILGAGILRAVNDGYGDGTTEFGIEYIGHCQFDSESIKYFENPIPKEEFFKVTNTTKFGHNAQKISKTRYFEDLKELLMKYYDDF